MAIGKKTKNAPEIGDLVTVKLTAISIYGDDNGNNAGERVPKNANLGAITAITDSNDNGDAMYLVSDGWVYAEEVTTKVNSVYNYGAETVSGDSTTQDSASGGFWGVFGKVLDLGVGIFTKKKTGTTDSDTTDTTQTDAVTEPTEKKGVPTWVWITGGVVIFGGLMAALFWPKKPKPTPAPPVVITGKP